MKPGKPEPEFIDVEVVPPPGKTTSSGSSSEFDAAIGVISRIMDSIFRVPGTRIRFGLDPVVSLIPLVGGQFSALISATLLFRSVQHRLPKIVLARMALNIAINGLLDSIPLVGDFLSVFFKSNEINYRLLQRYAGTGKPVTHGDWLFVGLIVGGALLAGLSATLLVAYAVTTQFRWW
jgi:Domain of unknown function (DUF4112)